MKLLHIITSINTMKAHITFYDNDELTNYYILPYYSPSNDIKFLDTGTQLIKSKNIHIYKSDRDSKLEYINKNEKNRIIEYIKKISPDVVYAADTNISLQYDIFEFLKNNNVKIVFSNHGILSKNEVKLLKNHECKLYNITNIYLVNRRELELYDKIMDKVRLINGMSHIEYLLKDDINKYKKVIYNNININNGNMTFNNKIGIPYSKKSILYIQNKNTTKTPEDEVNSFKKVMKFLNEYANKNNIHIFCKIKQIGKVVKLINSPNNPLKLLCSSKNITVLNFNKNCQIYLHHFLWCNAIIVENYGTSLYESLLVSDNVVQLQMYGKNNAYGLDDYSLLPRANNINELEEWLNKFLYEKDHNTEEFKQQKEKYLERELGKIEEIKNNTNNIINIFKKEFEL